MPTVKFFWVLTLILSKSKAFIHAMLFVRSAMSQVQEDPLSWNLTHVMYLIVLCHVSFYLHVLCHFSFRLTVGLTVAADDGNWPFKVKMSTVLGTLISQKLTYTNKWPLQSLFNTSFPCPHVNHRLWQRRVARLFLHTTAM